MLGAATLFVVGVSSWPQQKRQCSFKESMSLFDNAISRRETFKDEMQFMVEFSRFINHRVPQLLQVKRLLEHS